MVYRKNLVTKLLEVVQYNIISVDERKSGRKTSLDVQPGEKN